MSAKKLNVKAKGGISAYSVNRMASGVLDDKVNITYDEIGNPVDIGGDMQYRWNGRQLQGVGVDGTEVLTYAYNTDGQRTKKVFSLPDDSICHTYEYFYNGSILAGQKVTKTENGVESTYTLAFMYDNNGDIFGFYYNDTPYYYIKNAQNDVVMVVNTDGVAEVVYLYDAWGNISNCYEMPGSNMSEINPLTYRSYYYDAELSMYYLNSRYYVPGMCRFLNADGFTQTGSGMLDKNLFAYCLNNPISFIDSNGMWAMYIGLSANVTAALGLSGTVAIAFDSKGNCEFIGAYSGSNLGELPYLGIGDVGVGIVVGYFWDVDTIYELCGKATQYGFSIGSSLYGSLDFITFSNRVFPSGIQFTLGIGVGVDVHVAIANTVLLSHMDIIYIDDDTYLAFDDICQSWILYDNGHMYIIDNGEIAGEVFE